jgi:hypothetical protein
MDCEIYWIAKLLRKVAKCIIQKTLIRTAVLYGCQSSTIMNTYEGKLGISERKVLRKIYWQWSLENKE